MKGNKFWKLRSKHGRDALFTEPEKLWEAACKYFEWCDNNPIIKHDVKGKEAELVEIPLQRPYTTHGLCIYLDVNVDYMTQFKKSKTYQSNPDFSRIIDAIDKIIYDQKFTGASVGIFNANIISRDLGLADKKDIKTEGNIVLNVPPESDGLGEG